MAFMPTTTRPLRAVRLAWIFRGLLLLALPACDRGEVVTDHSLAQARKLWTQAQISNYDLDWTSSGPNKAYYRVRVRDGTVQTVEQVLTDGRTVELHPGEPRYYGVDGLFLTLADEYAQLATDRPFGQPRGTTAVLRFTPDPRFGYPRSYRRDIVGSALPVAIDVVRFAPRHASESVISTSPDITKHD